MPRNLLFLTREADVSGDYKLTWIAGPWLADS